MAGGRRCGRPPPRWRPGTRSRRRRARRRGRPVGSPIASTTREAVRVGDVEAGDGVDGRRCRGWCRSARASWIRVPTAAVLEDVVAVERPGEPGRVALGDDLGQVGVAQQRGRRRTRSCVQLADGVEHVERAPLVGVVQRRRRCPARRGPGHQRARVGEVGRGGDADARSRPSAGQGPRPGPWPPSSWSAMVRKNGPVAAGMVVEADVVGGAAEDWLLDGALATAGEGVGAGRADDEVDALLDQSTSAAVAPSMVPSPLLGDQRHVRADRSPPAVVDVVARPAAPAASMAGVRKPRSPPGRITPIRSSPSACSPSRPAASPPPPAVGRRGGGPCWGRRWRARRRRLRRRRWVASTAPMTMASTAAMPAGHQPPGPAAGPGCGAGGTGMAGHGRAAARRRRAAATGATGAGGRRGATQAPGQGRAQRHGELRVGVDGHRDAQLAAHQVGDQRDPARPADQQDGGQVGRGQPGRGDRPAQGHDRLAQRRRTIALELVRVSAPWFARRAVAPGSTPTRVDRQRLLGLDAALAQLGGVGAGLGVGQVEPGPGVAQLGGDVGRARRRRRRCRRATRGRRAAPAAGSPRRQRRDHARCRRCRRPGRRRRWRRRRRAGALRRSQVAAATGSGRRSTAATPTWRMAWVSRSSLNCAPVGRVGDADGVGRAALLGTSAWSTTTRSTRACSRLGRPRRRPAQ